jgi:hypothetical protein
MSKFLFLNYSVLTTVYCNSDTQTAASHREAVHLHLFYTTTKIMPKELNIIHHFNKDSTQILSSRMESQYDTENSCKIYTGIVSWEARATCLLQSANGLHKTAQIIKELNY